MNTIDYTTVRLNRNLIVRVKEWAARHGVTISDAVSQLVSAGLESNRVEYEKAAAIVEGRAQPPAKATLQSMGATPAPLRANAHPLRMSSDESVPSTYRMNSDHAITDPMADLAAAISLLTETVRALPKEVKPPSGLRTKTG